MLRKAIKRAASSFATSSIAGQIIFLIIQLTIRKKDFVPLVPSYRAFFASDTIAVNVYFLLIGVIGATFGACSLIFELEKWSWIKQGVIHFLLTTIVWLPLATFLWGLYCYPQAVVSTLISMTFTYIIIWTIQYQLCKNSIHQINQKLSEMK